MLKHSICLLSALACSNICLADTASFSQAFGLSISNATNTIASSALDQETLLFPQFNPAWGTLTGVQWTLSNSEESLNLLMSVSRGTRAVLFGTSTAASSGWAIVPSGAGTVTLPTFVEGLVAVCGPRLSTSCPDTPSDTDPVTTLPYSPTNFASYYIGTGTVPAIVQLFAGRTPPIGTCFNPGNCNPSTTRTAIVDATWSGTSTLTYTYDAPPVPEPSTWALTAGSVGLLVVSRFRRRKAN
jgi:hypothetical protein